MQQINRKSQPFLLLLLEVFFVTFAVHINGFDGLFTLRNLAMGMILIAVCILRVNIGIKGKDYKKIFISWVIIVIYSVALIGIMSVNRSNLHNILRSTFNFLIMVVIIPEMLCSVEHSFKRYSKAIILATTIQSLIVIGSFLFPTFRTFLYNIQSFDENWLTYRTVGLGIAGAGGTVYLFCGFMVISYCILFKKHSFLLYLLQFIVLFAIILVGRTGFYMSLATIIIMVIVNIAKHDIESLRNIGQLIIALIISVVAISFVGGRVEVNTTLLESSFRRLNELWTTNRTLQAIDDMAVPRLTAINLFLGTGLTKGYGFDRILIWNDSGYVQRYFALGLLPAIISYYIFFRYCISLIKKLNDRKKRVFWICMVILLFIVEYKEAFIFYLAMPFTLIVSIKLEANSEEIPYGNI